MVSSLYPTLDVVIRRFLVMAELIREARRVERIGRSGEDGKEGEGGERERMGKRGKGWEGGTMARVDSTRFRWKDKKLNASGNHRV